MDFIRPCLKNILKIKKGGRKGIGKPNEKKMLDLTGGWGCGHDLVGKSACPPEDLSLNPYFIHHTLHTYLILPK